MTSIAELGIEINTDSVTRAVDDLDSLVDAGKGAEGAAKQVESSWAKAMEGLRGDTGQIVKELQALNASQAGIAQQMAAMGKAATDSSASFAAAAKAQASLATSTDAVAQAGQKMAESAEQQSARMAAVVKSSLEASAYHQKLAAAVGSTGAAMDAAGKSATDWAAYQAEINARGQALLATEERLAQEAKKAATATDLQADGLAKLLGQIDPVTAAFDRLDDQQAKLAKYKAAGLLDTETFRDYSTKIDQTRQKLGGFDESMKQTGVSAGQTQAALRQLPAQFSDIFTSLAGGQNPLMVLIQQGGQLKDSFGGIGPMFDALGEKFGAMFGFTSAASALGDAVGGVGAGAKAAAEGADVAGDSLGGLAEGANTAADASKNAAEAAGALRAAGAGVGIGMAAAAAAVLVATAAVGALVYGYAKGSAEADKYNEALIFTGNYAGTSADQLGAMADRVGDVTTTVGDAAKVLAQLAGTAKIPAEQFEKLATAALNLEDAIGTSASKTVAEFEKIADGPTKAVVSLNEKYGFLTASVFEQIRALEKQDEKEAAAVIAQDALARALNERSNQIKVNMGTVERAWDNVTSAVKRYGDAILQVGRKSTLASQLDDLKGRLADVDRLTASGRSARAGRGGASADQLRKEIGFIELQIEAEKARTGYLGEQARIQQKAIEASGRLQTIEEGAYTKKQKMNKELEKAQQDIEDKRAGGLRVTAEQEEAIYKAIRSKEEYKETAARKERAYTEAAGIRMLDQAKQQEAVLKQQAGLIGLQKGEYDKLGESGQALIKWEQQLADIKSKHVLTADQKSLLASQDKITAQLKINAGLEKENALKKISVDEDQKLLTFRQALADQIVQDQQGLDAQLIGMGMGSKKRQQMQESLRIEQDYQKQLQQLQRDFQNDKISEDLYNKETSDLKAALAERLAAQEDHFLKIDAAQANWALGASDAFHDYVDSAADVAGQTYDVFSNAFNGLEDVLVDFAMTGKLTFKEFANSIIADIARIVVRTQIVTPLLNALFSGGGGGGGGLLAGAAALFGGSSSSSSSSSSSGGAWSGAIGMGKNLYSLWSGITGVGSAASAGFASGGITGALSGIGSYYGGMLTSVMSTLSGGISSLATALGINTAATAAATATATAVGSAGTGYALGGTLVSSAAGSGVYATGAAGVGATAASAGGASALSSALSSVGAMWPLAIIMGMYQSGKLYDAGVRPDGDAIQKTGGDTALGQAAMFAPAMGARWLDFKDNILGKVVGGKLAAMITGSTVFQAVYEKVGAKLFGTAYQTKDTGIQLGVTDGDFDALSYADQKKKGGWISGSTKKRTLYGELDPEMQSVLGKAYNQTVTGVMGLFSMIKVKMNEDVLDNLNVTIGKISTLDKSQEDIQKEIDSWFTSLGDETVKTIARATSENSLATYSMSQLQSSVNALLTLNVVLDKTNNGLLAFSVGGLHLAERLAEISGGVEKFVEITNGYYAAFVPEIERADDTLRDIVTQFAGANVAFPDTREQFKKMVEAINLSDLAGQDLYVTLMNLAAGADAAYQIIESRESAYYSAFHTEAENTARAVKETTAQIKEMGVTLPGTRAEFRAMVEAASKDTSEAGKQLYVSLLKVAQSAGTVFDALESTAQTAAQTITDALLGTVTSNKSALERAINAEKKSLANAYNARTTSINDMLSTSQEGVSGLKTITNALDAALKSLRGTSDDAVQMMRSQAKATVTSALAIARAGGSLSNFEGLDDALSVISSNDTNLYSSLEDFNREQGRNANLVAELGGLTGKQLTNAEKTVKTLQDQLKLEQKAYEDQVAGLDAELEFAQQQIDVLNGVDVSVKSVAEAVRDMQAALIAAFTGSAASPASNSALIDSIYKLVLGNTADKAGKDYWMGQVNTGAVGRDQLQTAITNAATENAIKSAYKDFLDRPADAAGQAYWAGQVASGALTVDQLQTAIKNAAIANGSIPAHASGGRITGPGTGTSDSILSWLSNGEYVLKASAVRMFGVDQLDQMNAGRMPGFATGGGVGETGPVLQITRPSQIYRQPAAQAGGQDSGAATVAELKELRREMRDNFQYISRHIKNTADNTDQMANGGVQVVNTVNTKAVSV